MKETLSITTYSDDSNTNEEIELANTCPICGVALSPDVISGVLINYEDEEDNKSFSSLTIALNAKNVLYQSIVLMKKTGEGYLFSSSSPQTPFGNDWGEIIANISPSFIKIYNQSVFAEANNLDQIAGVGYRKALEFLIKDYLISKATDEIQISNIKHKFLGKCINEDIDNPQLKIVASRAVWLGNDHTHYEQLFDDKDISDLKRLIRLTVHWISLIKETEEAESIQPRK